MLPYSNGIYDYISLEKGHPTYNRISDGKSLPLKWVRRTRTEVELLSIWPS